LAHDVVPAVITRVAGDRPIGGRSIAGQGESNPVFVVEAVMNVALGDDDKLFVAVISNVGCAEHYLDQALSASARCLAEEVL
jgi:hypothetical protein